MWNAGGRISALIRFKVVHPMRILWKARFLLPLLTAVIVPTLVTAEEARPVVTAETARQWADELLGGGLRDGRFSAAVVTVVKGNEVLLLKGYGPARVEHPDIPIDPATSLIRIQSVTKPMVSAMVALTQVEGLIGDIGTPANNHLTRVALPPGSTREITVADLITHRAGFEDDFRGFFAEPSSYAALTGPELERLIPARVREPGVLTVYNNRGYGMLAMLLEDVWRRPLPEVMRDKLFEPLGMDRTFIGHPHGVPDDLAVPGVLYPSGDRASEQDRRTHYSLVGSGGVYTTAEDMARYMIGNLTGRGPDGEVVLPETLRQALTTPLARNHPNEPAIAWSLFMHDWNGTRVAEHAGGGSYWTWMVMLPDLGIGMFAAVLSGDHQPRPEDKVRGLVGPTLWTPAPDVKRGPFPQVGRAFLAAFLGREVVPPQIAEPVDFTRYAGTYVVERRNHTGPDTLFALWAGRTVHATADGLMIDGRGPFRAIGSNSFVNDKGPGPQVDRVSFLEAPDGRISAIVTGSNAFTRIPAWRNPASLAPALPWLGGLAVTGLLAAFWPRRVPWHPVARPLGLLLGLCIPLLLAILFLGHPVGGGFGPDPGLGYWTRLRVAGVIATLAVGAALVLLVRSLPLLPSQSGWARLAAGHAALVSAAWIGLGYILFHVNMVGPGVFR